MSLAWNVCLRDLLGSFSRHNVQSWTSVNLLVTKLTEFAVAHSNLFRLYNLNIHLASDEPFSV